jgi:pyruvate/2-oxoglutarate dehydrogenase complex dihydrolipoamide acyltransferase (E2) component
MTAQILMPQLGETVAEGKIVTWFKQVGEQVKAGDKLFEVETDKVTVEVEATEPGTLSEIRVSKDVTAKVGSVVAVLDGSVPSALRPRVTQTLPEQPALAPQRSAFAEVATPLVDFGRAKSANGVRLSPLVRRLASEKGIDLSAIAEAAAHQEIRRVSRSEMDKLSGLLAAQAKPMLAQAPPVPDGPALPGEILTLNSIRQRTAERLSENWRTIPHVFQAVEVDFTSIVAARASAQERFRSETGASLTYLPFIANAVCMALAAFPQVNARFDGRTLAISRAIHLGIAVDLDHNGLVVPVVRNAGDLTTLGLAKAIGQIIAKARSGKLGADDLAGGTYSISNNGAFGTLFTSPIINAPQVAILSVDAIRKRPAIIETDEGDFVAPRMMGLVGQSFDHRAFDGAYSAAFLSKLKFIIETRDWNEDITTARTS